jgi:hypothetical protein
MSFGFSTAVRNARLDALAAAIDAGGAAGLLRIYSGARPASGGTVTTLLAELTFTYPCAAAASGGVLTFDEIFDDPSADSSGTATWARVVTSAGAFVFDCDVGTSGSDINLTTTAITAGATVSITSASLTEGNI